VNVKREINGGVNLVKEVIINNPGLNTYRIAEKLNKPERTVEKWLSKLKKSQIIEYRGSSKTGGYFIK